MEANFEPKDSDYLDNTTHDIFAPDSHLHYTVAGNPEDHVINMFQKTDTASLQTGVTGTQQPSQRLKPSTEDHLSLHGVTPSSSFPSLNFQPYKPETDLTESKITYPFRSDDQTQPNVYSVPLVIPSQSQASPNVLYAIKQMVDPQMSAIHTHLQTASSPFLKGEKENSRSNSRSIGLNEGNQSDLRNYSEISHSDATTNYENDTDIELDAKVCSQNEDMRNYCLSLEALSKYSGIDSVKSEYQGKDLDDTFEEQQENIKAIAETSDIVYNNYNVTDTTDFSHKTTAIDDEVKVDPENAGCSLADEDYTEMKEPSCQCVNEMVNTDKNGALVQKKRFICGGCLSVFSTICILHAHVRVHGSGGSYHFDDVSQTAYPKYDSFCSYTQTDGLQLADSELSELCVKIEEEGECQSDLCEPVTTRQSSKKLETERKDALRTANKLSPNSKMGGRKRKQDNPKPSKPRMYMIPIDNKDKSKKISKMDKKSANTWSKKRGKSLKKTVAIEEDAHVIPDGVFDSDTDDVDMESTQAMIIGNIESLESEEKSEIDTKNADLGESVSMVVQENTVLSENKDEMMTISKPFKKRGRARKTEDQFQKSLITKDRLKSSTGKRTRKTKKQKLYNDDENDADENEMENETDADSSDRNTDRKKSALKRKPAKDKQDKLQVCDICGLSVPRHQYIFHMRQHTGERPFICEKCGKAFARSRFLTKHLVTHEEVKPWQCHMCTAQFCQKNEYKMHMAGHAGDRPHLCNVCEMRFLSKTSLLTHQANIHMGLTRFECEVCKRRFFKRSSLNVHQATHFEATLKCEFCDRKFRDKTGLKRHERIHTGVKKFMCHICDHAFIQSTPFWSHMEKRHSMSKAKVKEMLKDIREVNRRSGIKTEISVLPRSIHDPESLQKMDPTPGIKKSDQTGGESITDHEDVMAKIHDLVQHNMEHMPHDMHEHVQLQRAYSEIKIPSLHPVPVSNQHASDLYNQHIDSADTTASLMLRHYGFTSSVPSSVPASLPSTLTTGALSLADTLSSSMPEPINLSNPLHSLASLPSLAGLPSALQHALSMGGLSSQVNSLHHHGYIGFNTLQQALDYTSTIPQSASYTDISQDRVVNEPQ